MTYLFEAIASGVLTYIHADDLHNAIKIFEKYYVLCDSDKFHVYVRLV